MDKINSIDLENMSLEELLEKGLISEELYTEFNNGKGIED